MITSKWTYFKIWICILLLTNVLDLVKSDLYKMEGDHGTGYISYAGYIPTIGAAFPAPFPVYFIENHEEIPLNRFGFNVIYGSPSNIGVTYPYLSESSSNISYGLPEHYSSPEPKDDVEPYFLNENNYANEYPSESTESTFKSPESKNPLISLYDDWSPEEDEGPKINKENDFPPKNPEYKTLYKTIKPTPVSYVREHRYPHQMSGRNFKNSRTQRMNSQYRNSLPKSKSYSTHHFYKSSSHPNRFLGKLHHREHINSQPQRKLFVKTSKQPFRPSPPDVFLNSQKHQEDYSTGGSSTVPKYFKFENPNSTIEIKMHTCVKTNKTRESPPNHPKKIMHCYICVDNKSRSHYEECSFDEIPKLKSYTSYYEKLAMPQLVSRSHDRGKREVSSKVSSDEQPRNKRGNSYYESDDHQYGPYNENYRFGPEHFAEDERMNDGEENSYESDDPNEKCWKKRKGEMLCISCENMSTGGTYEQCSYASDPNKQSYDHSVSKEYGSSRVSEDDGRRPYDESVPDQPSALHPPPTPHAYSNPPYQDAPHPISYPARLPNSPQSNGPYQLRAPASSPYYEQPYRRQEYTPPSVPIPHVYTVPASTYINTEPNFGDTFGRYHFDTRNDFRKPYNNFDDTFSNIFPEIANNPDPLHEYDEENDDYGDFSSSLEDEEGQFTMYNNNKVRRNPGQGVANENNNKMDIKRAIDEFSHKNRTACKKLMKAKMTCYQCVDEKGIKREDCLLVRPLPTKSNKISYHKFSEFNSAPRNDKPYTKKVLNMPAVRFVNPRGRYIPPQLRENKIRAIPGNAYNPDIPEGIRYARSSSKKESVVGANENNSTLTLGQLFKERPVPNNESKSKSENDNSSDGEDESTDTLDKVTEKYNPVPTDPTELKEQQIPNSDGKFAKDTELVFDPLLGMSLPKYMLEKTEHEAIFDEILASG